MKLKHLYAKASADEWARLASAAGVTPEYLGQVARGWSRERTPGKGKKRVRLSLESMVKLAAADPRLRLADLVREMHEAPASAAA